MSALIIISAPSGSGKSTFIERILKDFDEVLDLITVTTRSPREGESQGQPYYFMTDEDFKAHVLKDHFVEWAQVHEHFYGTPHNELARIWGLKKVPIADLDIQGAFAIKKEYPEALLVFLEPPSIEVLKERLLARGGKLPSDFDVRMKSAAKEMAVKDQFDLVIKNDDFERAYAEFIVHFKKYLLAQLDQSSEPA